MPLTTYRISIRACMPTTTTITYLDLAGEVECQVLVDDTIRGSEECQHMGDEVPLIVTQPLPVLHVMGQIQLLSGPEARLGLLVHVPDLWGKNGKISHSVRRERTNGDNHNQHHCCSYHHYYYHSHRSAAQGRSHSDGGCP